MKEYLEMLFDSGEYGCVASSLKNVSTSLIEGHIFRPAEQWIVANPLRPHTTRCIANITSFRNFVIEIDNRSLDDQEYYITAMGLPWTTCTFSGSKSYHYVVCLTHNIGSQKYREWARKIGHIIDCDTSCLQPANFTRLPGAIRDNGAEQTLVDIRDRHYPDDFELWINKHYKHKTKLDNDVIKFPQNAKLSNWARKILKEGIRRGGKPRHIKLLQITLDLHKAGLNKDLSFDLLKKCYLDYNGDKTIDEVQGVLDWVWKQQNKS